MSRFIETLCIQNGEIRNLEGHQKRCDKTRYKKFGFTDELDLAAQIKLEENQRIGKFKCRILYGKIVESVEILSYEIRKINSIKLVLNNEIDYRFKSEDRAVFELIKDSITEDEIIILKNGEITDTSYSNLVFFDGENWITPTSYLLNGTMRQSLLQSGRIKEEEVNPKDFNRFVSFKLINAMMDLDESPELDISIIS